MTCKRSTDSQTKNQVNKNFPLSFSCCLLPGTILVHCSAGVGRTGTFLAVYKLWLDYINPHVKELSVFTTVLTLRRQRCLMVQKNEQYAYIAKSLRFRRKHREMTINAFSSVLSSARRKATTTKAEGFINKQKIQITLVKYINDG